MKLYTHVDYDNLRILTMSNTNKQVTTFGQKAKAASWFTAKIVLGAAIGATVGHFINKALNK